MNDDLIPCEKCPTVAICKSRLQTEHYPYFLNDQFIVNKDDKRSFFTRYDIHNIEFKSVREIILNCSILYNRVFARKVIMNTSRLIQPRYVREPYAKLIFDFLMER